MAVTNQPKNGIKSPAWAQRGKLRLARVEGGPARAAALVLQETWDGSPQGLASMLRYAPALVEELAAKKINAVILDWSLGFSKEDNAIHREIVQSLLPILKKKKIRAIAEIAPDSCFPEELARRVPDALNWLKRDASNTVQFINGKWALADTANAGWRKFVETSVVDAIDVGFSGVSFSFFGESNAGAEFLRHLRIPLRERLKEEFEQFAICVQPANDPVLSASANLLVRTAGIKSGFVGGLLHTNMADSKYLFELNGRDVSFARGFSAGELTVPEAALAAAEAFATGGASADLRTPRSYQAFMADNGALFAGPQPVGNIGIILDDKAVFPSNDFVSLLARANLQFDVIPAHLFSNFDFKKYTLLSTLYLDEPSPELRQALAQFVERGGIWLAANEKEAADTRTQIQSGLGKHFFYSLPPLKVVTDPDAIDHSHFLIDTLFPDIVAYCGEQPIHVDAPDGVVALLWGRGTRRWVHVLNYRAETVGATITLPNCGGRSLAVFSPDAKTPELEIIETGNAHCVFNLNCLETYAIVEIA